MRKNRLIATVVTTVTVVTTLASCGGTSNNVGDTSSTDSSEGPVLTVMSVGTAADAYVETYEGIGDDFSASNDYDATVEMEFYEKEQYKTKLPTLMASNSVPDIFFTWELDYLRPFVEGGKVLDLTPYLEADPEWRDSLVAGSLEPLTYDGGVYAIPTQSTFATMFYNTRIFEENGLEVPTTADEFLNVCEVLKGNGITPMTMSGAVSWIPAQLIQQISVGIGGMDLYNGIVDGSIPWNNEIHVEAAEDVQYLIDQGYFQEGMLGMSDEEAKALFQNGEAAMYFQGAWEVSTFIDQEATPEYGNISMFTLPAINPENNDIMVGSVDSAYAISADCENPDAAVAFLKYYTSVPAQERLVYEQGRLPAIKMDLDETRLDPLVIDASNILNSTVGRMSWWDRVFGAGEGVEFNNQCQAIIGGEDAQTAFDDLQEYADANADR